MPSRGMAALSSLALACVLAGMPRGWAEDRPRAERAVAIVGSANVGAEALERRIRSMPEQQRVALGWTGQDAARRTLQGIIVPELLYAIAARGRRLEDDPGVRERTNGVLRAARVDALLAELSVKEGEVASYYATHAAEFEEPLRLGLWRILCATEEEARKVLAEAESGINAWRWKDMSREHSVDRSTKWRGGDLGYVSADGSSSEAGLRVDPALFAAAERVADGMLVAQPVPEGDGYAVVWRRETIPPVHRSLEQEASAIRQVLMRRKAEESLHELVRSLRDEIRPESHADLLTILDGIEVGSGTGAPQLGALHGRLAPAASSRPPSGSARPSVTPRGIR